MAEQDNAIFVGDKPFMNYVTGIVMQFTTHEQEEVIVKARGKHISRAVDVTEMAVKRFLAGQIRIRNVSIDSNEVRNREGKLVRVSTIEISLERV